MENASKALLMAGGIMLTILIISILLYSISIYSDNQKEQQKRQAVEELTKFNLQFTNYARDDIMGYELLSLVNKVIDYNQRESEAGETTDSPAGNYFLYTPIKLEISFIFDEDGPSEKDLRDELRTRTSVTIPAVARTRF